MELRIARVPPGDWRRYREFRLFALQESPTAFGSTYARELAFAESLWRQRLAENLSYLATDRAGEVVGTATGFAPRPGELHVVAMYVAPAARRSGCATALLDVLVAAAREQAYGRLVLDVAEGNEAAAGCYRRYGFVPTGTRKASPRDPEAFEIELAYDLGAVVPASAGTVRAPL